MTTKKNETEVVPETKTPKAQELLAKQIWESGPKENPFDKAVQVSIHDVKDNYKGVAWVKFSRFNPNVGNTPFEYLSEKDFRAAYPLYISPEL